MNCTAFERWLDDGRPAGESAAALAHARACAHCARAMDAALELEAALAVTLPAPSGFTDRVMARVAGTPQDAPGVARSLAAAPMLASPFPWWVRTTMEPAIVLAAVLAAVVVRFGSPILRGAGLAESWLAGTELRAPHFDAAVWFMVAMALLPALALGSWQIYRWSESLATRGATVWRGSRIS